MTISTIRKIDACSLWPNNTYQSILTSIHPLPLNLTCEHVESPQAEVKHLNLDFPRPCPMVPR